MTDCLCCQTVIYSSSTSQPHSHPSLLLLSTTSQKHDEHLGEYFLPFFISFSLIYLFLFLLEPAHAACTYYARINLCLVTSRQTTPSPLCLCFRTNSLERRDRPGLLPQRPTDVGILYSEGLPIICLSLWFLRRFFLAVFFHVPGPATSLGSE